MAAVENTGRHIKVFNSANGSCLYEFKRGIKTCLISSVNFDSAGDYLGISSNTGTVHLFAVRRSVQKEGDESKFMGGFKSFFSLETSVAKLHLQEKMGCCWTAKEGTLVGPMVSFSKDKGKFVSFLVIL